MTKNDLICELCGAQFENTRNYNRHKRKKKTSCVSQERCEKMYYENQSSKTKLNYLKSENEKKQEELAKKEYEIKKLKEMMNKLVEKDSYVKETLVEFNDKIDEVKETIEDSKDKFFTTTNNQIINNNTVINNDNKTLFHVSLSEPKKERLDHITKDMMLQILNHDNMNDALGDLTRSIYFHPKCPENWRWSVTDPNAKYGTLEYSHESHTLIRKETAYVIKRNLENVMFPVTDLLDELRKTRNLNEPQALNCSRLLHQLGNDFTPEQINYVKKSAYAGRNFPKALWDSLSISVETTPISCQIKSI